MSQLIPSDLEDAIDSLRYKRRAVILAHYYQDEDIQDIADFVGDSLDLSRRAAATDAEVIVFCGVRFMAETAKILAPERIVVLPDNDAGCSLEDSCKADDFRAYRQRHPDHFAVTYINCSAEVKALSDLIVTSSNAEALIKQIPLEQKILFAPDRHLGAYLAKKTKRDLLLWQGVCVVHEQFSERSLIRLKTQYPQAQLTAHPECSESVLKHADHIGSTAAMLAFVTKSDAQQFIIATEKHIIHQMHKRAPHKTFIPAPAMDGGDHCDCARCPYMAMNTMEKLYLCLQNMTPRIELDCLLYTSPSPRDRTRSRMPSSA